MHPKNDKKEEEEKISFSDIIDILQVLLQDLKQELWEPLGLGGKLFFTGAFAVFLIGSYIKHEIEHYQEIANLREQIQQLEEAARYNEPDVSEYGYTVDELQEQVNTFEADNDSKSNEISDLESQIRDMEFEINDLQNQLDDCENSR